MAVLAVAAGGAVAGGVIGGLVPGVGVLLGVQLGFLGGAILGNILFPNEIDVGGPSRDDVRLSSSAIGRFIPIPYGTTRIGGQYLWVDEPVFTTTSEDVGKGGGAEVKSTKMSLSWISGICEGAILAVTRIWLDDDVVFDISPNNPEGPALSPQLIESLLSGTTTLPNTSFDDGVQTVAVQSFGPIRIYLGNEDQPLEPMLQNDVRIAAAFVGQTDPWGDPVDTGENSVFVPPLHGLAYAAFDQIPGDAVNNHFPQVEFEVLKVKTDAFNATEYEPVPSRSRGSLLKDRVTFVSASTTLEPIYRWNTVDKNPTSPESWNFTGAGVPFNEFVHLPLNVGTWDDPDLLVFVGAPNAATYHMATGAQVNPRRNWNPFFNQPKGGWYYPNTANPTHFIGVATTNDIIFSISLSWDADTPFSDIAIARQNVAIPGTGISTAAFQAKPGFIGPDGLLYIPVSETGTSNYAIAAFDPLTLEVRRALEPYLASPSSSDDFWSDLWLTYDAVTDKIIIATEDGAGRLRRVDRATLTLDPVPDIIVGSSFRTGENRVVLHHGPFGGVLWLQTGIGNKYQDYDIWNWTEGPCGEITGTTDYGLTESENEIPSYDPINGGIWVQAFFNTDWLAFMVVCRAAPGCVTAESIAQDISDRCEVPATLRDTSGWASDIICGYLIGRRISGRKALEPISGAINGDFRTQDGKVQFFKLDTPSIKTIPEDDLGVVATFDESSVKRNIAWPYERELPDRVDIQFVDYELDYNSNTIGFDRPREDFKGRAKETVHMPIVFWKGNSNPEVQDIAERLLYAFDANRRQHVLQLTWEHLDLNVGDAFTYVDGDFNHVARIEKWALAENNMILIEAKSEDVSINTGSGQTVSAVSQIFEPSGGPIAGPLGATLFLLDAPLFRDQDDDPDGIVVYVAAATSGAGDEFPGGQLQKSIDGGVTWQTVTTVPSGNSVTYGRATNALGATTRPYARDRVNSLSVTMVKGTLPGSVTNTDLYENGQLNAVLVGDAGRWEVLRFADSVNTTGSPDDEKDSYTLSDLRRARRGTDHAVGGHAVGDFVLLLEASKFRRIVLDIGDLNVARLYRLVTIGQPASLATPVSFTLAGESAKPYTLTQVKGTRNISTGAWSLTAVRRTRKGGKWVDFTGPPLSEESEQYEVDVLTGPGGTVALTKTGLTSPSVTLTEAELVSAGLGIGGSPGESPFALTVRWYQISAKVGRGNSVEVTLTSPSPGN